jgi:hypothetical protein
LAAALQKKPSPVQLVPVDIQGRFYPMSVPPVKPASTGENEDSLGRIERREREGRGDGKRGTPRKEGKC